MCWDGSAATRRRLWSCLLYTSSDIVEDVKHGLEIAEKIGYPVVLRPAYTLGGSGGGIAENPEKCAEILENGLRLSRVGQVLVERCIAGWKEVCLLYTSIKHYLGPGERPCVYDRTGRGSISGGI